MNHPLPVEDVSSLLLQVKDLLAENPPPPGAETHLITVFHGQDMTLCLAQIKGTLKPHIHLSHEETIYVLDGKGQALIGDRWRDIGSGTVLHFQGKKVHSIRAEPGIPLIFLCHFVPGMKELDRVFVE